MGRESNRVLFSWVRNPPFRKERERMGHPRDEWGTRLSESNNNLIEEKT